jgi:hypothetical protein
MSLPTFFANSVAVDGAGLDPRRGWWAAGMGRVAGAGAEPSTPWCAQGRAPAPVLWVVPLRRTPPQPRGRTPRAASEGSRGGLRRDHGMSQNVTLPSRCRDVTLGHDPGSAREDAPWSGAGSTMLGHHRTTDHHRVSRDGNSGPVLSLPCRPMSSVVRIPPAGRCQRGAEMARTKPICRAI